MAVIVSKGIVVPSYAPPVGTTWLYENNSTFEVPADGIYQGEMHGGGGGGGGGGNAGVADYRLSSGQGGGASGNLFTCTLTKGEAYAVEIGAGGAGGAKSILSYDETYGWSTATSATSGGNGGTTYFGEYSISGGQGGKPFTGYVQNTPKSYGNIATNSADITPGEGNKNNVPQTYGDGGAAGRIYDYYDPSYGENLREEASDGGAGKPGAVIITFMGVE